MLPPVLRAFGEQSSPQGIQFHIFRSRTCNERHTKACSLETLKPRFSGLESPGLERHDGDVKFGIEPGVGEIPEGHAALPFPLRAEYVQGFPAAVPSPTDGPHRDRARVGEV